MASSVPISTRWTPSGTQAKRWWQTAWCSKWSGPGCQASRSPVSRTTELQDGWPSEAQAANAASAQAERPEQRHAPDGRAQRERLVRDAERRAPAHSIAAAAQVMDGLLEVKALEQVEQAQRDHQQIAACQARRRRLSR